MKDTPIPQRHTSVRERAADVLQSITLQIRTDIRALRSIPGGPLAVAGGVLLTTIVFGLLRVGIRDLYTESLVFLGLAFLLGLLGWSVGLAVVVLTAVFDLLAAADRLPFRAFVGRLITYVVLAILVVAIPAIQRRVYFGLRDFAPARVGPTAAAVASAVTAGALVYPWTVMTPYLIRPAFPVVPTVWAVAPLQTNGDLLALFAAFATLVVAVAYQRTLTTVASEPEAPLTDDSIPASPLRRGLWYGLVVVLFAGLITSLLDVALLVAALVGSDVLTRAARRTPLASLLGRVPWLIRLAIAAALSYWISLYIFRNHYQSFAGSEFYPIVVAIAVGLVVYRFLMDVPTQEQTWKLPRVDVDAESRSLAVGLVVGGLIAALALVPGVVVADNCSGLSDCNNAAKAAAAAGASAAAGAAWKASQGRNPLPKKGNPLKEYKQTAKEVAGEKSQKSAWNFGQKVKDMWNKAIDALAGKKD